VREGDRSGLSRLTESRGSGCPPGSRVCLSVERYGLTPREVTLIALISSGKSGRAISQTLGVEMKKIRQYCGRIHGKIATRSRLGIGLWAIRKGMVKSVVQPESDLPGTGPPRRLTFDTPGICEQNFEITGCGSRDNGIPR
jgi:DNA-binding CsgD family transcriptional regulator